MLVLCLLAQSCPTLCDPMDCNLPGSSVHGDSSGKNTRVGCHALLQRIFPTQGSNPGDKYSVQIRSVAQLHLTLCSSMDFSSPGSSVHGDSSGKNTGVGCHALLQGIFPTQESNPGLLLQADSLPSEPPQKPKNTGVGSLSLFQGIF